MSSKIASSNEHEILDQERVISEKPQWQREAEYEIVEAATDEFEKTGDPLSAMKAFRLAHSLSIPIPENVQSWAFKLFDTYVESNTEKRTSLDEIAGVNSKTTGGNDVWKEKFKSERDLLAFSKFTEISHFSSILLDKETGLIQSEIAIVVFHLIEYKRLAEPRWRKITPSSLESGYSTWKNSLESSPSHSPSTEASKIYFDLVGSKLSSANVFDACIVFDLALATINYLQKHNKDDDENHLQQETLKKLEKCYALATESHYKLTDRNYKNPFRGIVSPF